MIEIELLDSRVDVVRDAETPVTLTGDDAWLVVALALAPPAGLHAVTIRDTLRVDIRSGALRKRIERLRARTGLTTTSQTLSPTRSTTLT